MRRQHLVFALASTLGSAALASAMVALSLASAACQTGDAPYSDYGSTYPVNPPPSGAVVIADGGDAAIDGDAASTADGSDAGLGFDAAACLDDGGDAASIATHTFPWNFTVAGGVGGQQVSVKRCDLVSWNNTDTTDHTVTSTLPDAAIDAPIDGAPDATLDGALPPAFTFDTGVIAPSGTSKRIQFTDVGVFPYHCGIHGPAMSGHITVH